VPAFQRIVARSALRSIIFVLVLVLASCADDALFRIHEDAGAPAPPEANAPVDDTVPSSAGSFLYYWTADQDRGSGRIMRLNLQGSPVAETFWPAPSSGGPRVCSGCHSVSPDGRYVAMTESRPETQELAFRVVDTTSGQATSIPGVEGALFAAWNPRTDTDPPHQFLYMRDNLIYRAAVTRGAMGTLRGAADPAFIQSWPAWGPGGKVAFARQPQGAECRSPAGVHPSGGPILCGPTDLMLVDEDGGVPSPLPGASGNGMANYHPAFSPDGRWIAFTQSASAVSTYVAADAQIRLVRSDGSGGVHALRALQSPGSASSWPTWSLDGAFLSFSSNRPGGMGGYDIYIAPIDPETGADGPAEVLTEASSPGFDHIGRWAR
jgi:WD40 repeat protein